MSFALGGLSRRLAIPSSPTKVDLSNFTSPSVAKTAGRRSNVSVATAIFFAAMTVMTLVGCDTQQHLANSQSFVVTASADSTAIVPNGWRRTKHGWEHTSKWGIRAATQSPPSMQQWIERTADRNPIWARAAFSRIRQLSPITIALIQIALIAAILRVSQRFTPQTKQQA